MTPEGKVKVYLKAQCIRRGWDCLPLTDPSKRAWPDRTIIADYGVIAFVEVKAVGVRHPADHLIRQKKRITRLKHKGHLAFFAVGNKGIDRVISAINQVIRAPYPLGLAKACMGCYRHGSLAQHEACFACDRQGLIGGTDFYQSEKG